MKELDMIKSFAKLEGIEIVDEYCGKLFIKDVDSGSVSIKGYSHSSYNPIDNLALNCAARDKYETDIEWYYESVSMQSEYTDRPNEFVVRFSGKDELPKAVIECILKSEGKWNES